MCVCVCIYKYIYIYIYLFICVYLYGERELCLFIFDFGFVSETHLYRTCKPLFEAPLKLFDSSFGGPKTSAPHKLVHQTTCHSFEVQHRFRYNFATIWVELVFNLKHFGKLFGAQATTGLEATPSKNPGPATRREGQRSDAFEAPRFSRRLRVYEATPLKLPSEARF